MSQSKVRTRWPSSVRPWTSTSAGFTATTASGYAELQIPDACALTEGLAANQVKSKGNQKAFCNHLRNATKDLQNGKTSPAIRDASRYCRN